MGIVRKAVFPVGGLGTRFLPATKSLPKEMLPIVDKPLVQYAFEEALEAGIEEFIFVTGRNKTAITNHFDQSYELESILESKQKNALLEKVTGWLPPAGSIMFTRQQAPLGLGHAVWCARHFIHNEPFAVLLADDLIMAEKSCLSQMITSHPQVGGHMVAVQEVPQDKTDQYGILDVEEDMGRLVRAKGLIEKPKPENAPSRDAVIGRYILQPDIFDYLDKQKAGAGGEIQLTDAIMQSMNRHGVHGFRFQGERFDCGSHEGFLEANIAFGMNHAELGPHIQEIIGRYATNGVGKKLAG